MTPKAQEALNFPGRWLPAGITAERARLRAKPPAGSRRASSASRRCSTACRRPTFRGQRRRHATVLHRAQSSWHYRCRRSRRLQHLSAASTLRCRSSGAKNRCRCGSPTACSRRTSAPNSTEYQQPHAIPADGIRRRHAALQRHRRADHRRACTTTMRPTQPPRTSSFEMIRWAATQGLAVTIHWQEDKSVPSAPRSLRTSSTSETPIAPLALVHRAPRQRVRRNAGAHEGARYRLDHAGRDVPRRRPYRGAGRRGARRMPPIVTALRAGVHVGAGTDAHRVAILQPVRRPAMDARRQDRRRTIDARPGRNAVARDRPAPLHGDSAWFSFDETRRGSLEIGKLADFAILDQDYFSVPVERIGRTALAADRGGRQGGPCRYALCARAMSALPGSRFSSP